MSCLRPALALTLVVSLNFFAVPSMFAGRSAVAILTLATHARLNDAEAFPGLSVYEGERLSTEVAGRLGVHAGRAVLMLGANTEIELIPLESTVHVDMCAGSLHFAAAESDAVEIHAEDATISSATGRPAQGQVTILAPKVLQISVEHGSLNFRYHDEFRTLPEGQTYKIYLDPPEGSSAASVDTQAPGKNSKVAYYILGAAAMGGTIWGIRKALEPGNEAISPAKP